jgi:hypothetical protein
MAGSDVKAKRLTATGSAGVGPARIRQIQIKTTTGTPRLTITDGNGGATVLDMDFLASDSHSVNIPQREFGYQIYMYLPLPLVPL